MVVDPKCECVGNRYLNDDIGHWCYLTETPCTLNISGVSSNITGNSGKNISGKIEEWDWIECDSSGEKKLKCPHNGNKIFIQYKVTK